MKKEMFLIILITLGLFYFLSFYLARDVIMVLFETVLFTSFFVMIIGHCGGSIHWATLLWSCFVGILAASHLSFLIGLISLEGDLNDIVTWGSLIIAILNVVILWDIAPLIPKELTYPGERY